MRNSAIFPSVRRRLSGSQGQGRLCFDMDVLSAEWTDVSYTCCSIFCNDDISYFGEELGEQDQTEIKFTVKLPSIYIIR